MKPKEYWLVKNKQTGANLGWTDKKPAPHIEGDNIQVIHVVDANAHADLINSMVKDAYFCPMDFYETGIGPQSAEEVCEIINKRFK